MNATQLAVLMDALEACGEPVAAADVADILRWARNPDAVRTLLDYTPTEADRLTAREECAACAAVLGRSSHQRNCPVAAAWRALGDPRATEDIERAHEEALRLNPRGARGSLWTTRMGFAIPFSADYTHPDPE